MPKIMRAPVGGIPILMFMVPLAAATLTAARRPSSFGGTWIVTGVAVSDRGVQVLGDDDPSLMGKVLRINAGRLAWDPVAATGDACVRPTFERRPGPAPAALRTRLRKLGFRDPTPYAVRCRRGSWGPDGRSTVYLASSGQLAMPWYDGGVLKLERRR